MANANIRRIVAPALLLLVVLGTIVVAWRSGGDAGHRLSVVVSDASSVIEGQELRLAGNPIGEISSVTPVRGGRAVRLGLDVEDSAWPLPQGTKLELRWAGTLSFNNRYIAVTPGPRGARPLPDGGTIPTSDATIPVEFDKFAGVFDKSTRGGVRKLLRAGGTTLESAAPQLRRALDAAPPALAEGRSLMRDLTADRTRLDTLVTSADALVDALNTSDPGVRELVQGSATTFAAIADEARALQGTLQQAPTTLARARTTLANADGTLSAAGKLTGRLAPGVRELRRIASPLNEVLATVGDVAPDARATLFTARRATPDINPLLRRLTERAPQIASIGRKADHELNCIRPYTPEIAAFASTWGDFVGGSTDGKDVYFRAQVQHLLPLPHNVQSQNSGEIFESFPGLRYGFPRPPGAVAGQPWFLEECGAGPAALDPFRDPEGTR